MRNRLFAIAVLSSLITIAAYGDDVYPYKVRPGDAVFLSKEPQLWAFPEARQSCPANTVVIGGTCKVSDGSHFSNASLQSSGIETNLKGIQQFVCTYSGSGLPNSAVATAICIGNSNSEATQSKTKK